MGIGRQGMKCCWIFAYENDYLPLKNREMKDIFYTLLSIASFASAMSWK